MGIANDLTNPMVSAFKKVMPELSNTQASLVQFAFYFGYFFMALPATFQEFNYFLVSLWGITCGSAFLETISNPLILALEDSETATQRLNLAQAFHLVGSFMRMIVA